MWVPARRRRVDALEFVARILGLQRKCPEGAAEMA